MIDTNYSIEALEYLLNEDCLSERYYPIIQFKNEIIRGSKKLGYRTKNEIAELSDSELKEFGLQDAETIALFRRFLKMYDPNPQKFKEIEKLDLNGEKHRAFNELYYLPGVKNTRASLYFYAGYKSLKDIAKASVDEIIERTALAISKHKLTSIVPLPKEVRTHIAVAKAFTKKR